MPWKRKQGGMIFVFAVSLVLIFAGAADDKSWAEVIGFILLAVGLGLNLAWYRCSHCGEHLGKYPGEYCTHCGKAIDYDAKT